jgi:hypothetical protein
VKPLHCADHHPIRIGDERERLVTASPVMTKSRAPAGGNNYPENCLVKPPRCDARALSPAGMFGGKAPLRLAALKSRLHAPSVPMRSAPAYFLCKWGVITRILGITLAFLYAVGHSAHPGMFWWTHHTKSSQVKLILSPKQRAKPAASRTRTCTNPTPKSMRAIPLCLWEV